MKPFTLEWWMQQLIWATTLKTSAIDAHNWKELERWKEVEIWVEQRIINKYGEQ